MSKKKREITAPSINGLVSNDFEKMADGENPVLPDVEPVKWEPKPIVTDTEEKPQVVITEIEKPVEKKINTEKIAEMQKEIQRRRGNYSSAFEQELLARRGQAAPPKRSFEGELARRRKLNR